MSLVNKTMKSSDLITFVHLNGCNGNYYVCFYIVFGCIVFIVYFKKEHFSVNLLTITLF